MNIEIPPGVLVQRKDVAKWFCVPTRGVAKIETFIGEKDESYHLILGLFRAGYTVKFPRKTYDGRLREMIATGTRSESGVTAIIALQHHDIVGWWLIDPAKCFKDYTGLAAFLVMDYL